ncbi:MAG: PAS domain S-box protein [bacterium]|nr:PAS domain S-box protein [bacterium]
MADRIPHPGGTRASWEALRVVAVYAAVGLCWVLLWDSPIHALFAGDSTGSVPGTSAPWVFLVVSVILVFLLVQRQLTRLAKREERTRNRQIVLRDMLDVDVRPMALVDCAGAVVACNRAAAQLFGRDTDSLTGTSLYGLVPAENVERLRSCIEGVDESPDAAGFRTDAGFGQGPVRVRAVGVVESGLLGAVVTGIDPDERRRTEAAVESTRQSIESAVEGLGLGLWELDLASGKARIVAGTAALPGLEADRGGHDFATWREMLHPDDRRKVEERMVLFLQGEAPMYEAECRVILPTGEERWLLTQARIIERDADDAPLRLLGSFLDITDRRYAEERVREGEAQFRRLVENARDVVYRLRLRPTRGFDYIGPAVRELTGHEAEELRRDPQRAFRLIHPKDRTRIDAYLQNPKATSSPRSLRLVRDDGTIMWTEHQIAPVFDDAGECVAVEGILRDVTERKQAEEATRKHQEQLVQTDKLASLGILVSGVAHEINNPNFVVGSSARSLSHFWDRIAPIMDEYRETHADDRVGGLTLSEVREYVPDLLKALNDSSARIKDIVQELRDFVRQNPAGHLDVVSINSVVQSSVTLMRTMIGKSTERFNVAYGEGIPELLGNYRRLEQVIVNLLQNACQALPDAGRAIEVTTAYDETADEVVVSVRDEGIGVPKANLPRLVEPFFTTRRESGGTGLGLSICATIVHEHHGDLQIDSSLGDGMTVRVQLPRMR